VPGHHPMRTACAQYWRGDSASLSSCVKMLEVYEGEAGGLRLIQAARDLDPNQTAQIGESLRTSRVPALVLWGRDDRYLGVESVARPLAELLGARLTLLPGGHFTPVDCPREVSTAVCEFARALR
jgi:pimeloyl-ACP methyl ester carboxylesterase